MTLDQASLRQDLPTIYAVHSAVKAGLEQARDAKVLGSSLQCSVVISVEDIKVAATLERYADELDAMFVVSSVDVNVLMSGEGWTYTETFEAQGAKGLVSILPPKQSKCARCWRYLATEEDGLCKRCDDVVAEMPSV